MKQLIFMGYEFTTSFIPFLIVLMILRYLRKRKRMRTEAAYYIAVIILAFYVIAVFHFTGAGTLYEGFTHRPELKHGQLNIIPFSKDINIIGYLLNILLFVPFGTLVPFIWQKRANFIYTVSTAFLFSLLIELSQSLNNRSTDIDDLLLNTLGAVIGFILYKIFMKATKNRFQLQSTPNAELLIYIAAMFLGRFLFFDETAMARLLYGF